MSVTRRHIGPRGAGRVDVFLSGPYEGQRVIVLGTLPDRACIQAVAPSGTVVCEGPGSGVYDYWQANVEGVGDFAIGNPLSKKKARLLRLTSWFEFWVWRRMMMLDDEMINRGFTNAQRRQGLRASLFTWGIPLSVAIDVAANWVNSGIKPAFGDLHLDRIPLFIKEMADALATLVNE